MLKIKTVDEAGYISAVTNEVAEIIRDEENYICFKFENNDKTLRAHKGYGREMDLDDGSLLVDLSSYLSHIRNYNKSLKNFNK